MSLGAVRLLGKRRAFYLLISGLLIYMVLVGASASVVRAVIMGIVFLFANRVGRQGLALNPLFLTALLMTLYDPMWLWDVGFQLSFVATLGLILYATPLQKTVEGCALVVNPRTLLPQNETGCRSAPTARSSYGQRDVIKFGFVGQDTASKDVMAPTCKCRGSSLAKSMSRATRVVLSERTSSRATSPRNL